MTVNYVAKDKLTGKGKSFIILAGVILFYILAFEFIIPVNGFLPKPSILYDSLIFLQQHYHLVPNLLFTTGVVIFSIGAGYMLVAASSSFLTAIIMKQPGVVRFFKYFHYFPLAGIITLFVLWLPDYMFPEVIFTVLFSAFYLISVLRDNAANVRQEYIDAVIPLGLSERVMFREIVWKSAEPEVIYSFSNLYSLIWIYIIFFEFIKGNIGTGYVLRMCLQFNDLSGVFLASLLVSVFMLAGELMISYLKEKLAGWES